jgi:hypothetical protein
MSYGLDCCYVPGVTAVVADVLSESVEYHLMAVDDRPAGSSGTMLLAQSGLWLSLARSEELWKNAIKWK